MSDSKETFKRYGLALKEFCSGRVYEIVSVLGILLALAGLAQVAIGSLSVGAGVFLSIGIVLAIAGVFVKHPILKARDDAVIARLEAARKQQNIPQAKQ